MKLKKLDNKGELLFSWVFVLAMCFIIVMIYTVSNDFIRTDLYDAGVAAGGNWDGHLDWLITVWDIFPILSIGGLLFYGVVMSGSDRDEGLSF